MFVWMSACNFELHSSQRNFKRIGTHMLEQFAVQIDTCFLSAYLLMGSCFRTEILHSMRFQNPNIYASVPCNSFFSLSTKLPVVHNFILVVVFVGPIILALISLVSKPFCIRQDRHLILIKYVTPNAARVWCKKNEVQGMVQRFVWQLSKELYTESGLLWECPA
jgi:hypothetical protein